jgi:sugar phosphate isomerase/epimerase
LCKRKVQHEAQFYRQPALMPDGLVEPLALIETEACMSKSNDREWGRADLIASAYTLSGAPVFEPPRFSFAQRVAAAAKAGFAGIGVAIEDYAACRERGMSGGEMRRILDDHAICVAELEFLQHWWQDDERSRRARASEDLFYAAADALGSRHVNVGCAGPRGTLPALEIVAEHFAALCDRAARHGLLVAFEFLPWSDVPDVATAWQLIRLADRKNGGILIDTWHYFRGAADPKQVRSVPADRLFVIQFDDADAVQVGGYMEDTTRRRRLPGQGAFDLIGFIQMLDGMGVDAPISVEILSDEQRTRPLDEAARLAHDTTQAVLAQARERRAGT